MDKLDDVFVWGKNGKTYFFYQNLYWRFSPENKAMDPGYPKDIIRNWRGIPRNIDAALTSVFDGISQSISAPAKIGVALQSRSGSIFGVALRVALRLAIRSCAPACAPTPGAPRSDRAPTKNSKNVFSTPKNGSIWLKMAQKTKVKHLVSRHFFCNKLPLSFVAENGVRCVFS